VQILLQLKRLFHVPFSILTQVSLAPSYMRSAKGSKVGICSEIILWSHSREMALNIIFFMSSDNRTLEGRSCRCSWSLKYLLIANWRVWMMTSQPPLTPMAKLKGRRALQWL
jgi:hypothetical protein